MDTKDNSVGQSFIRTVSFLFWACSQIRLFVAHFQGPLSAMYRSRTLSYIQVSNPSRDCIISAANQRPSLIADCHFLVSTRLNCTDEHMVHR